MPTRRANDDPIVLPGKPGASHLHEFYGNFSTDANSTSDSLYLTKTTCDPASDKSAYWTPTLFQNGVPVSPSRVTIYYQGITDHDHAQPLPFGLRYVAGNALATSPDQNPIARWSCLGSSDSSQDFMDCPDGEPLQTYLNFPTCWDGVHLDSSDHKSELPRGFWTAASRDTYAAICIVSCSRWTSAGVL
ncbi:DUF1996 domain-containing protein [Streptacidiphilus sp. PAMC 29251]